MSITVLTNETTCYDEDLYDYLLDLHDAPEAIEIISDYLGLSTKQSQEIDEVIGLVSDTQYLTFDENIELLDEYDLKYLDSLTVSGLALGSMRSKKVVVVDYTPDEDGNKLSCILTVPD